MQEKQRWRLLHFEGRVWLLAFLWVTGIISGCFLSSLSIDNVSSLMRSACATGVSIVWLILWTVLPLLIVSIAAYYRLLFFVLLIAFARAFTFGLCCCIVYRSFGSAGWLVARLMLFTGIAMLPMFFWLCLRCLEGRRGRALIVSVFTAVLIAVADYLWISPFLSTLMT